MNDGGHVGQRESFPKDAASAGVDRDAGLVQDQEGVSDGRCLQEHPEPRPEGDELDARPMWEKRLLEVVGIVHGDLPGLHGAGADLKDHPGLTSVRAQRKACKEDKRPGLSTYPPHGLLPVALRPGPQDRVEVVAYP